MSTCPLEQQPWGGYTALRVTEETEQARANAVDAYVRTRVEAVERQLRPYLADSEDVAGPIRAAWQDVEPEALRWLALELSDPGACELDWELGDDDCVRFPALEDAERRVEYVHNTRVRLDAIAASRIGDDDDVPEELAELPRRLAASLDGALDMPRALEAATDFLKHANELAERAKAKRGEVGKAALQSARSGLDTVRDTLGLGREQPAAFLGRVRSRRAARAGLSEAEVQARIDERVEARARRDFARADAIRDALAQRGVELMDSPRGTTWRIP